MNETPPATPVNPSPQPAPAIEPKRPVWPYVVATLLAVVLYFVFGYLVELFTHESTDDAFITAHVTSVAPRISGQVVAVHVRDNQMVQSNDVLVELDPSDYAAASAQKSATAEAQTANYQTVLASLKLMQAKLATAQAVARQSQADADAAEATAALAQADFERAENLRKQNTTSAQEFDIAQAALKTAQANLNSARQKAAADQSKIAEVEAELAAMQSAVAQALAQSRASAKEAQLAQLNLTYAKVLAPADGRVTRKAVEVGDYLQTGQQILSLVPAEVWVVANFKESQLARMAPGQPVVVEIDALGGRQFRAHVDSVQAGSGAAFSLLPPENATGNFVKVVQRVPVKIVFDEPLPADKVIGPGLSVTPSVETSKFTLPQWMIAAAALVVAILFASLSLFLLQRKANGKKA